MMGHNDSKLSAALVIGVIALVLSVYSTIAVIQMGQVLEPGKGVGGGDVVSDDFDDAVKRVIEDYVEEQTGQRAPNPTPSAPAEPVEVGEGDGIVKGDPDAPVTIVEFSDYQCPFCKRHVDETYPLIEEQYIDTGQVRYVFRDFPLTSIHPRAIPAANAARCVLDAGDLDDYWAYHDILFKNQSNLSDDALKTYAQQVDVNAETVGECIDEGRFVDAVNADLADGQSLGVTGTPASFVNGRLVSGAQPFGVFQAAIEQALEEAE